ncbi:unnamed protein product [Linum trigynum]|uniref:Uncharacterized protein n=1 Tax=Linum trigynum TaxID=586398 RepID=A0AAV2ELE6_9ROSI
MSRWRDSFSKAAASSPFTSKRLLLLSISERSLSVSDSTVRRLSTRVLITGLRSRSTNDENCENSVRGGGGLAVGEEPEGVRAKPILAEGRPCLAAGSMGYLTLERERSSPSLVANLRRRDPD